MPWWYASVSRLKDIVWHPCIIFEIVHVCINVYHVVSLSSFVIIPIYRILNNVVGWNHKEILFSLYLENIEQSTLDWLHSLHNTYFENMLVFRGLNDDNTTNFNNYSQWTHHLDPLWDPIDDVKEFGVKLAQ